MENYEEVLKGFILLNIAVTQLDDVAEDTDIKKIIKDLDKNIISIQKVLDGYYDSQKVDEDMVTIDKAFGITRAIGNIL